MGESLRDTYMKYRAEENKDEILRLYFNMITGFKYNVDYNNFFVVMCQMLDRAPGLEEDISTMYPNILKTLDVFFALTFVVEVKHKKVEERVLKQIL